MKRALAWVAWAAPTVVLAQVQHAQPPPDFRSGYVAPHALAPLPRADVWQYADVFVLALVLLFGAWAIFVWRSRQAVRLLTFFSVAYFGFIRLGCVCAIGSIQNVAYAAFHSHYAIPWVVAAFFVLPLVTALFFGRVFCGTACPMGALQDILLLRPVKVPGWLAGPLGTVPYLFLGASVLFAALGSSFLICQTDPFISFFRLNGGSGAVSFGVLVVILSLFVGRPYCRFLCPYSVLLRWASVFAKHKCSVTPEECLKCHLCADACPYGAIDPPDLPATGARRAAAQGLILLPLFILVFAFAGARVAPMLSSGDARVVRAVELQTSKPDPTLTRAEAWRSMGKAPASAYAEAIAVERSFRLGTTWLGGWFGLVFGLRLLGMGRRGRRAEYEVDGAACVSCARCYAACPVPNRDRFARLANLLGEAK